MSANPELVKLKALTEAATLHCVESLDEETREAFREIRKRAVENLLRALKNRPVELGDERGTENSVQVNSMQVKAI